MRCLNIETASIKSHVKNENAGHLRLLWWRESIEGLYNDQVLRHHVLDILYPAIKSGNLNLGWFKRLIDKRMEDLHSQPQTMQELENYCEDTVSSLLYLSLESLNIRDINADHAASHIGKAIGIVTLLKAFPYHAKEKQIYIPNQIAAKYKVNSESIFNGEMTSSLSDAIFEIASIAHEHIELSREMSSKLPKNTNLVLLPTVCIILSNF